MQSVREQTTSDNPGEKCNAYFVVSGMFLIKLMLLLFLFFHISCKLCVRMSTR